MLKLGNLELGRVPRIVVSFDDENVSRVDEAKRSGLDIAELRIDLLSSQAPAHVDALIRRLSVLPTIATIRARREGGSWSGTEAERLGIFRSILPRVDAVDVELSSESLLAPVAAESRQAGKLLIVSHHDFEATPGTDVLAQISERAMSAGAHIVKIATQIRDRDDLQTLSRHCLSQVDRPMIVIGMGGRGLLTRLAFPAFGSLMTFGFIGKPSAPGQIPFDQLYTQMSLLYPEFKRD